MAGQNGFGAQFGKESETPGTFDYIADAVTVTAPSMERETLDVTSHDSADGWREFKGGLKDPGEVEIEVNYDPANHDALIEDFDTDEPVNYQIVWSTGATWTFPAFLTGFEAEAPHDDKMSATLTFKVSGKPTTAPAE